MKEEMSRDKAPEQEEYHKQVVIPLLQHKGIICEPSIDKDETVLLGQKIGNCDHDIAAPIHASISGHVVAVEERSHPYCTKVSSIIIESNGNNKAVAFKTSKNPSREYALNALKESGVIDLDENPIYHTLTTDKLIDTVLINLTYHCDVKSNCSPENIPTIVSGMKVLIESSEAQQGAFIINKNDTYLASAISSGLNGDNISIFNVDRHYTPTMLNLLAHDITGMRLPRNGTPADVGVIISSAYGALATCKAVHEGIPPVEVNISVEGAVQKPDVRKVDIGTSFKDVIGECGGYDGEPGKIIMNGLLTGTAQYTDEVPVIKTTNEILVQSVHEVVRDRPSPCVHCARCVDVCPANILPGRIAAFADIGRYEECEKLHVQSCVECGLCSYICPSKRHNLQLIMYAKHALSRSFMSLNEKQSPNLKLGCCQPQSVSEEGCH